MRRVSVPLVTLALAGILAANPAMALKGGGGGRSGGAKSTATAGGAKAGSVKPSTLSGAKAATHAGGGGGGGAVKPISASPKVAGPPQTQTAQGIAAKTSAALPSAKPTAAINHQQLLSGRHWQLLAPHVGLKPVAAAPGASATPGLGLNSVKPPAGTLQPLKSPNFANGDTSGVRSRSPIGGGPRGLIVPGPTSPGSSIAHPFAPNLRQTQPLPATPPQLEPPAPPAASAKAATPGPPLDI